MNSPQNAAASGAYTFQPVFIEPPTVQVFPLPQYAGFVVRLAAFVIDFLIIYMFLYLTSWGALTAFYWSHGEVPYGEIRVYIATAFFWLLFPFIYFVFFLSIGGQTPGKMALRIKVVPVTGGELGGGRAVYRTIGYLFSSFFFMAGFLWAALDRNHQTWHDKIAGTVVLEI